MRSGCFTLEQVITDEKNDYSPGNLECGKCDIEQPEYDMSEKAENRNNDKSHKYSAESDPLDDLRVCVAHHGDKHRGVANRIQYSEKADEHCGNK